MKTSELKIGLHSLIDQLDNKKLLEEYYLELKRLLNYSKSTVWENLSNKQQKEVLMSYDESDQEGKLIDHESVMGKHKKWR